MRKRKRITAKLRLHPDPILTTICEPVKDGEDVSDVIRDMMHVLTNSKTGVGLAAPQAGHLKRIIIIKESEYAFLVMVNPFIEPCYADWVDGNEGCLSYPGIYKTVKRLDRITAEYRTENGGSVKDAIFDDFPARIIQHEIDHLNGKCQVGE